MAGQLLIRADAGHQIGTGHVMRCLALAQAWQDRGGRVLFAAAAQVPGLERRLGQAGCALQRITAEPGSPDDAAQTAALAHKAGARGVVIDGYHFDSQYQQALKHAGLFLLCIDDFGHADRYCADLVLNQNIGASEQTYAGRAEYTRLLLGTRYVLLRREFHRLDGWRRQYPDKAHRVLVSLGGADCHNVTGKVISALGQLDDPGLEAVVVLGPANPHVARLAAEAAAGAPRIKVVHDVHDMAQQMVRVDMAVSAGGCTCWELAFTGLPAILIATAVNQHAAVRHLAAYGAAIPLDSASAVDAHDLAAAIRALADDAQLRRTLGMAGRQLVDGRGTERVVEAMQHRAGE